MSWNPPLEIGLWNAWILMLFFPLQPLIMIVIDKAVGSGDLWKKMGEWPVEEKAKRANLIYMVLEVALIAYSIFLPLKLGSAWFTAGLAVYLVGLIMIIATLVSATATPPGRPVYIGAVPHLKTPWLSVTVTDLCRGGAGDSLVDFHAAFAGPLVPAGFRCSR